jgi:flagellar motor switch protein FliN/FliY
MNSVLLRHEEWIPMANAPDLAGPTEAAGSLKQGQTAATVPPPAAAGANSSAPILGPGDIEALLKQDAASAESKGSGPAQLSAQNPTAFARNADGEIAPADIDLLITQAEQALASINAPTKNEPPPGVAPFKLIDFSGAPASTENATIDLIRDVELDMKIELGRTHMYLEDVLKLSKGAVVPLDKLAGDPVDIYVNGRLIARGEVLILNDNFCVRVAELVAGEEMAPTR